LRKPWQDGTYLDPSRAVREGIPLTANSATPKITKVRLKPDAAPFVDILPYLWYGFPYMKTTLNIDDTVMNQLKREAARQDCTMSELVETALRLLFRPEKKSRQLPRLPTFRSGGAMVDVADRNALYQAMEGR